MNKNSICPPLLGACSWPLARTGLVTESVQRYKRDSENAPVSSIVWEGFSFILTVIEWRNSVLSLPYRSRIPGLCDFPEINVIESSNLPSLVQEWGRKRQGNGKPLERLQNCPETAKRRQRTTKVWFSSYIFFRIHYWPRRMGLTLAWTPSYVATSRKAAGSSTCDSNTCFSRRLLSVNIKLYKQSTQHRGIHWT